MRLDVTPEEAVLLAEGIDLRAEHTREGDLYTTLQCSVLLHKLDFAKRECEALDELARRQEHRA